MRCCIASAPGGSALFVTVTVYRVIHFGKAYP
jgi:hypothetical protein